MAKKIKEYATPFDDIPDLKGYTYVDPTRFKKGQSRNIKNLIKNLEFRYRQNLNKNTDIGIDLDNDKLIGTFRYRW